MPENQNFYIIQHSIRWSGMPTWNNTLNETQMWQFVTFSSNIEKLPPARLKKFEPPASTDGCASAAHSHQTLSGNAQVAAVESQKAARRRGPARI